MASGIQSACIPDQTRSLNGAGPNPGQHAQVDIEVQVEAFETMKKLVAEIEDDVAKAEGGNKAAGVRVRKIMQDIKAAAQEVREKVLVLSKTEEKA